MKKLDRKVFMPLLYIAMKVLWPFVLFQYPKTSEKTPTNDITYYKFEPAEWKYEMQGADQEFNEISNLLREELDKHSDDDDWF